MKFDITRRQSPKMTGMLYWSLNTVSSIFTEHKPFLGKMMTARV